MTIKEFQKNFPFPQDIFWTIWLQFRLPHRKVCRILERFWSANFEELTLLLQKFLLKGLLETWNSAMTILRKKVCQKLNLSARRAKKTLKSALLKTFFEKRSNRHIEWNAVLTALRKSCSPEVRETFLSGVGKSLKDYSFYFLYLPQSVSLDSLEAIMLNLPINICHCPENSPSSSVVHFFTNGNLRNFLLDKEKSVLSTLPDFCQKFRKLFADRCDFFMKLYILKQIVSLKPLLWTFRKQLWQLWRESSA